MPSAVRRVLRPFDGTGPMAGAGTALVVLGLIFAGAILISSQGWEWWQGKALAGTQTNGLVTYSYHGHRYTFDNLRSFVSGPITVYIDPSRPSRSATSLIVPQVTYSLIAGGPLVAGASLVIAGFSRRRNLDRRRLATIMAHPEGVYGDGLDPELVARLLARRRAEAAPPGREPPRPPRPPFDSST